MKKLLIPIVALLAFSVLCTSVSANMPYYMASFYGEAEGCCWVFEDQPMGAPLLPDASGKGSLHVRGSAIVVWDPSSKVYWAWRAMHPNTRLWTRRTRLTVSWGSEKLKVWMWSSYETMGMFNDTTNTITLMMMNFFGYYTGEALEFIRGIAVIQVGILPTQIGTYVLAAAVSLYIGSMEPADHFRTFVWQGEETEILPPGCLARRIIHGVAVWGPIPWHPTNSIL